MFQIPQNVKKRSDLTLDQNQISKIFQKSYMLTAPYSISSPNQSA